MSLVAEVVLGIVWIGLLGCMIAERVRRGAHCECTHRRVISRTSSGVHICHTCIKPLKAEDINPAQQPAPAAYVKKAVDPGVGQQRAASDTGSASCSSEDKVIKLDSRRE